MSGLQILAIAYLAVWAVMASIIHRETNGGRSILMMLFSAFFGASFAAIAMVVTGGFLLLIAIAFGWAPQ